MNHKYLYLLLLFLIVSCQRNVETGPPVLKEMCQRLFPRHAQSFLFELLTDSIDTDRFILESSQGKIRIKGNNRNSLAAGLNHYLKTTVIPMFPGMPQRQWKCLMYYRRYLSQYISVPNVTIVFSQLLYIRLYYALLEMAGLGTTDRLDGIKRSHHASCYYRTRIHLVQSMDRHGFERRTGSLILYRASPSSLASDVQCRLLAKSTTSILAKGSGGITKTYSRKRT